jgi:nicotinamidase-related amidase
MTCSHYAFGIIGRPGIKRVSWEGMDSAGGTMQAKHLKAELPLPDFYDPESVGKIWRVPYQEHAVKAREWARLHAIQPAAEDEFKILLFLVDVQNTFCIPGFELFVGGRSGMGAVEDNQRLCEFIYRNLRSITSVTLTMDTHRAMQIFHPIMLIDAEGRHPEPYTLIATEDIESGRWSFNPALASMLGIDEEYGQRHLLHYTEALKEREKYELTIWPYHAMLGGIGHALAPAVEEAVFFHTIARYSQPDIEIKGENALTEHYSVIGPEVVTGPNGEAIASRNEKFINDLEKYDMMIIAGQAKSHCVAWTIADLLEEVRERDPGLTRKIYLLEDCSSPVVIPGVIDYTEQADEAYRTFGKAGIHLVRSTAPIGEWEGVR